MRTHRKHLVSVILVALLLMVAVSAQAGSSSVFWHWISPSPSGLPLTGIAYGSGTYVAVGQAGLVLTSADGVSWSQQRVGTYQDLTSIAYGNSRFVASGTGLFTSPDGKTWSLVSVYGPAKIIFRGLYFFGCGYGSNLMKSVDGVTWVSALMLPRSSGGSVGVAFGNGVYVCVLDDGKIFTSPDSVSWTQRYSPVRGRNQITDIAFANDRFVAIGYDGSHYVALRSRDGVKWAVKILKSAPDVSQMIVAGNGEFLVPYRGGVMISPNGRKWKSHATDTPTDNSRLINQEIYAGGQYIAVGQTNSYDSVIDTSPDGLSWESQVSQALSTHLTRVQYLPGADKFVGVGYRDNGPPVAFSPDGQSWQEASSGPSGSVGGIAFDGFAYVAVGSNGLIETSSDLSQWSKETSGVGENLHDVAFGSGLFAAVGQNGIVLTSPDGETWTRRSSSVTANLNRVVYAGGLFVAAGSGSVIVTSPDGLVWTQRYGTGPFYYDDIFAVTYVDGTYLCPTWDGLLSSRDGVSWITKSLPALFSSGIVKWRDTIVAAAYGSGVDLSQDLDAWTHDEQGLNSYQFSSLATDGETLVGACYQGLCWGEPAPYAGRISPAYGPVSGGTDVDISGFGLGSIEQVLFESVPSPSVIVEADGHILATSPPNTPGPKPIAVVTANGIRFPGYPGSLTAFFCDGPAAVDGIAPLKVSTAGNSRAEIWGDGLVNGSPPIDVTVGGASCGVEGYWRVIDFNCPAHPSGPADVVLTTHSGHVTTLPSAVVYVDPPSISSVKLLSNPTHLKIKGENFHAKVNVLIDGYAVKKGVDKSSTVVVAKGAAALNSLLSPGTHVITVLNEDDGIESLPFQFQK